MTKARLDGIYLLLLGSLTFIMLGAAFENASPVPMIDFKGLYYPARCLIQHCDPYKESEVLRVYQAEGADLATTAPRTRLISTQYVYQPTSFSVTVPFAMLPWGPAHFLWMALTFGSLIYASCLIWSFGANYAPIISGSLIGFLLANSELIVITGNAAGIAIGLCIIAVACFYLERFVLFGILCFAISLAIKPHDTGLVWLYFLLAGGVYRKRALQTLVTAIVFCLPSILWVWHVAPHWMQEMQATISAYSLRGGLSDPGPASTGGHGLGMMVNLQVAISFFRDDPRIYNAVSYIIFALLLIVWAIVTLRFRPTPARTWLALAAIAPLTMLPFYHRQNDTLLLLLTVPACAMLWAEGRSIGRAAFLINTAGLVLTGFLPWLYFYNLTNKWNLPITQLSGQIMMAVQALPPPLILLMMSIFYLWAYVRSCTVHTPSPPL
jgi:hypothetical protein